MTRKPEICQVEEENRVLRRNNKKLHGDLAEALEGYYKQRAEVGILEAMVHNLTMEARRQVGEEGTYTAAPSKLCPTCAGTGIKGYSPGIPAKQILCDCPAGREIGARFSEVPGAGRGTERKPIWYCQKHGPVHGDDGKCAGCEEGRQDLQDMPQHGGQPWGQKCQVCPATVQGDTVLKSLEALKEHYRLQHPNQLTVYFPEEEEGEERIPGINPPFPPVKHPKDPP